MVSAASKKYHRNFIIFSNEDSGYEEGKKPSGHLLIEVRDRRERLSAVIQNLRNGNGRFGYVLYLIRTREGAVEYVRAGEFRHSGGKAELEMVFDQGYVDGSVYSVDEFDTFAVLVETERRAGASVTCPLAGYRNGRTDWRGGFRKAMQKKLEAEQTNNTFQHEDYYQPGSKTEYPPQFELSEKLVPEYKVLPKTGAESSDELDYQPETPEVDSVAEMNIQPETAETAETVETAETAETDGEVEAGNKAEITAQMESLKGDNEVEANDQEGIADYADVNVIQPETVNNMVQTNQDVSTAKPQNEHEDSYSNTVPQATDNDAEKYKQQVQQPPGTEYKYPGSTGKINTECVYLNGNICGAILNGANKFEPCSSCQISRRDAPSTVEAQAEGNLDGLEEEFYKSFDICDPFHSKRSDYIWWRVTNPVNLNNMFYQNNIRSPLMFNPAVMMAHYKYKHLIVGVFMHKTGQRYLICGVPGMYMVDPSPFGEMSKWVQAEGNRQRYGAFGYWLLYINTEDSKIINF